MQIKLSFESKSIISNSIWASLLIYGAIAFLPGIAGSGLGLDPSWIYGISYASLHNWIFGKDIIFTYGPLGYLLNGAAIEQNFYQIYWFKLLIHILFFAAIFFQIIHCKTLLQKIALYSSTVLLLSCTIVGQEYQIVLLALLTALNNDGLWQSQYLPKWSVGLGVLAGLALLSKFTVGVITFAVFFIYLSVALYSAIARQQFIQRQTRAIANFLLATGSTLVVFLHADRGQGLLTIVGCLAIAGCVSLGVWFSGFSNISNIRSKSSIPKQDIPTSPSKFNRKWVSAYSFYLAYSCGLVAIVGYFSPTIITYLQGCFEISSGYSNAMVLVGLGQELGAAIFIILLTLILIGSSLKFADPALSLSLSLILFLAFKHGFTRADVHVSVFAAVAPFLIAVCLARTTRRTARIQCGLGYVCTLIVLMYGFSSEHISPPGDRLRHSLNPSVVLSRWAEWSNPTRYKASIIQNSADQLSTAKLPPDIRTLIGDRPVDIVPWEISLVAANDLNWRPRPIFQSYSAYTQFLDNTNFNSLAKGDRDYIIYSFFSIDGRHPFFDEPKTFFQIFCNYKLRTNLPDFNILTYVKFTLLEKRSNNICFPSSSQPTQFLAWNKTEVLAADESTIVRASFKFQYSLIGKIYKTLFRAAPIKLQVNYVDGLTYTYRMVSDNANNGVMISHLARNEQEAFSLFNNIVPSRVKSFSLHTNNRLIYQPTVETQLTSYRLSEPLANQSSWTNLAQLTGVKFLTTGAEDNLGAFDGIQVNPSEQVVSLSGWAAHQGQDGTVPVWLLITAGATQKPLLMLHTGSERVDVAQFLHEPRYTRSGWLGNFNANELAKGKQVLTAWFFDPKTNSAVKLDSKSVEIK